MEQAFKAINPRGKFQGIVIAIVLLVGLTSMFINIAFPFLTKRPEFFCMPKGSPQMEKFNTCPKEKLCKKEEYDYTLNLKESFNNWSQMFNFYCEDYYYVPLIGSVYFFGGIIACIILSHLPDKYGRKKLYQMLIVLSFIIHLNCLIAFSPVHLVIVNLLAGFNSYAYSMSTLIVTEYLDRRISGMIMSLNNSMIELAGIFSAVFYVYFNNTRLLFAFTSLCSLAASYLVMVYFVESPHWLNCHGRYAESLEELRKISRINNKEDSFNHYIDIDKQTYLIARKSNSHSSISKPSESIFTIFTYKSQRKKLLYLTYIWFSIGFTFYGLFLNLAQLEGDLFTMSIMMFIAEIIAEISSGWLSGEFGRIKCIVSTSYIGGFTFFCYEILPFPAIYKVCLLFVVSFCFAAAFNIAYVYSAETFPTSIRSTVTGYLFLISRFGAMAVPTVSLMIPRPPIIFAIFSVLAGFLASLLEETLGKPLEDDIPERSCKITWESRTDSNKQTRLELIHSDCSFSGARRETKEIHF